MRLPAQHQTCWGYAAVAFATALLFCVIYLGASLPSGSDAPFWEKSLLIGGLAFSSVPAALIAWPRRTRRSALRMVLAGFLTVVMAFAFIGLSVSILAALLPDSQDPLSEELLVILISAPAFIVFGSIFTLGVPHMLGIFMSLLFRDDPA